MKLNTKITLVLMAVFMTFFGLINVLLKGTKAENISVEEQIQALIEVIHAYYRQGSQIQYDSYRKNLNSTPEDATSQHYNYTVCSGLAYQLYYQTLGIKIPDTTAGLLDYAEANQDNSSIVLAFYGSSDEIYSSNVFGTSSTANYSKLVDKWVDILQPGDVLTVTGHTMIIESIDYQERKIQIIESAPGTRYDFDNHVDIYDNNGTMIYTDLKTKLKLYYDRINNGGTLIERMSVVRFITDGETYVNEDNEKVNYTVTDAALSRLKYPDIDIEKIVKITEGEDVISNNILTDLGEYITYELTIKNSSDVDYNEFNVVENIDSKVQITDNGDGILDGNELNWTISSLPAGDSITLSYTVMIPRDKNLLGQIVVSTGYVDNIATSKIETLIGNKLNNEEKDKLQVAYNDLKDNNQVEREFINQIYLNAFDLDLGLTEFDNLDIISYDTSVSSGGGEDLSVKSTRVNDTSVKKYIYSNFYGLRIGENNVSDKSVAKASLQWNFYPTYELNDRARTITSDMLTDGDIVLVYNGKSKTTDSTLVNKAYLYIGGKLIRKTSSSNIEQLTGDELTVFLRNIIGENYIILRPSIAMNVDDNESGQYDLSFDSELSVDEEKRYVNYLNIGTTVSEFLNMVNVMGDNSRAVIYTNDKYETEKTESALLGSGDILVIYHGDEIKDKYLLSVIGDANGDGKFNQIDLVQMRKHMAGWIDPRTNTIFEKTGIYYYAIDMDQNGIINQIDLVRMRKKIAGVE